MASGLNLPVGIATAPGDAQHVFVVDLGGRIRVTDATTGAVVAPPFLDIHTRVYKAGDGGLVGACLDPQFASNGYCYLFYGAAPRGAWFGGLLHRIEPHSSCLADYNFVNRLVRR